MIISGLIVFYVGCILLYNIRILRKNKRRKDIERYKKIHKLNKNIMIKCGKIR